MNEKNTCKEMGWMMQLWLWWHNLGGVVAYEAKDCKPNRRPEFIAVIILISVNLSMLIFMITMN